MLGKGYIIEHCIAYIKQKAEEELYKGYITDAFRAIANNTSHLREDGMEMTMSYAEILSGRETQNDKPEITGEQVISNMKNKLRRLGKGGNPHGLDDSNSQACN